MAQRAVSRRTRRVVTRKPKTGQRKGLTTLALMGAAVLIVVALPVCLVFTAGMAPAIVAAIVDRHAQRYLTRTIAVLNLSGMVLPVITLMHWDWGLQGAVAVLFDPFMWLWMYGAAALGWLCYLGMPPIARLLIEGRAVQLEHDLRRRGEALVEEWGETVTGRKYESK